jgi:glycerol-3-phosphate dehydrogenase
MLKRFLKRVMIQGISINLLTVGIGVYSYVCLYKILYIKKALFSYEKPNNLLAERKITYENFKKKFSERIQSQNNKEESNNNNTNTLNKNNNNNDIESREDQIERLQNENYDLLIIGGGSVGAGVLLDAYTRGLKCGLIEAFDFASGTSSRSSKLIHGGLRYLEEAFTLDWNVGFKERMNKFALVDESLKERNFIRTSAVFMNKQLELVIKASNYVALLYYYNGVFLYQLIYLLSVLKNLGDNEKPKGLNFYFTPVKLDLLRKKIFLYEGQMNDARQNILSILSCITNNYIENRITAAALNYVEFRSYIYNENSQIIGVNAFDKLSKKEFKIRATAVANCTGIFCDDNFANNDNLKGKMIHASKGTHLIFKNLNLTESIMIPKTSDGRVLFIYPYNGYYLAGTTDKEEPKSFMPDVRQEEEDFIVKEMVRFSPELFGSEDALKEKITSKWSGFRPLVCEEGFNEKTNSKSLARSHVVRFEPKNRLYSLMGGKWTTYRNMGKELVDVVLKNEPTLKEKAIKCSSEYFKLKGSIDSYKEKYNKNDFLVETVFYEDLVSRMQEDFTFLSIKQITGLVERHGIYAIQILLEGERDKTNKALFEDYLESEVRYAIRNEMAIKPNDIICRRIGIGFLNDKISLDAIPLVSEIIGEELKMSKQEVLNMAQEAKDLFAYKI